MAVDPAAGTAYVANAYSNTVSVIDLATSTVTSTIPVGDFPQGVAMDPATPHGVPPTGMVWVTMYRTAAEAGAAVSVTAVSGRARAAAPAAARRHRAVILRR